MNLNELRDKAYQCAIAHGWHEEKHSDKHFLCLVMSELMEAVQADRIGRLGNKSRFEIEYNRYPALVEEEIRFKCSFEKNIKDSLPDELADACIRLLDLAGLRNIEIVDFTEEDIEDASESCDGETFTEIIYAISTIPIRHSCNYSSTFEEQVTDMILAIFGLAKHLNIDILWHINNKIRYNELRPYKHGKRY